MEITHLPEDNLFKTVVDGYTAYVTYIIRDGKLDIRHTIVPPEIGGRGIAAQLVKATYDYALKHHLQPIATCSYAVVWLQRHPEYHGHPGKDYGGIFIEFKTPTKQKEPGSSDSFCFVAEPGIEPESKV